MYKKLMLFCLLSFAFGKDVVELNVIEVTGDGYSKKDESFEKTKAVSTREIDASNTQGLDDVIRSVPGAFTNVDKSQGTVNVNIRGMSGFGRVNMMVDGVSQTFYSASSDDGTGSGGTASFGGLIDPMFITGVDIERGTFSGSGGVNALVGSANFRTLSVNDLVKDGNIAGFRGNFSDGSNNIGQKYGGVGGVKFNIGDSSWIGALYGYSKRKISQQYEVGGGKGSIEGEKYKFKGYDIHGDPMYVNSKGVVFWTDGNPPYNPGQLKQEPESHIAKVEYGDDYNNVSLQYRNYNTSFASRSINHDTYQINYNLKDPNNSNIDLNVLYAYTIGEQEFDKNSLFAGYKLQENLTTTNKSRTLDINNKFINDFENGFIETKIGISLLKNNYKRSRDTHEINYLDRYVEDMGWGTVYEGWPTNNVYPEGGQEFNSIYLDNSINFGIFTFDSSFNWTKYSHHGDWFHKMEYMTWKRYDIYDKGYKRKGDYFETLDSNFYNHNSKFKDLRKEYFTVDCSELTEDENIAMCKADPDKLEKIINSEDYDGWDEFPEWTPREDKPYYKGTNYGKDRFLNYSFGLSAYVDDMFIPFINHSKTHRAPNIKEMYFSEAGPYGVNSDLKPEEAKTWQIGFNSFKDGVFNEDDAFRFKFLTYKTKIKNYIVNKRHKEKGSPIPLPGIVHYNYYDDVNIKGIEVELGYDTRWFFTNISYARQKTDQPLNFTDTSLNSNSIAWSAMWIQGYGLSKLSMLPKDYATIEVGTRLFNEKLTIGAIAKYYGESRIGNSNPKDIKEIPCPGSISGAAGNTDICGYTKSDLKLDSQGFIYDFYVTYQPTKNLTIKGEIQNVFDKAYINPLDSNNDSSTQFAFDMGIGGYLPELSNYARGRTALVSFNYEF